MNDVLTKLQDRLGQATLWVMYGALAPLLPALVFGFLGFAKTADAFSTVAAILGYLFAIGLVSFLLTSLVAAIVRWLDSRSSAAAN